MERLRRIFVSITNLITQAKRGVLAFLQVLLGLAYADGVVGLLSQNDQLAIEWLSHGVENGSNHPEVLVKLGMLYDSKGDAEGSSVYHRKAYELYHRAAEMGSVTAKCNLGHIYHCGIEGVVDEDLNEAFKWFKRAAGEEGLHDTHLTTRDWFNVGIYYRLTALRSLYKYYLNGDCPEQQPQPAKALYYLERVAELGDVESQRDLGRANMTGSCTGHKDLGKAERWLEKAAKKGDMESQKLLEECKKEAVHNSANEDKQFSVDHFKQAMDIAREKLDQSSARYPFVVLNPILLTEEVLRAYPESPTAQMYLEAYKLMKEGLGILRSSNYTNRLGLLLFAQAYLTENTILHSFSLHTKEVEQILAFAYGILSSGEPTFFEGVVVTIALVPGVKDVSGKADCSARITVLDNLIHLIQKAEPESEPQVKPYEFDKNYSSWLHVLFFWKAALYSMSNMFLKGALGFSESLGRCPMYLEAKLGLGYCLYQAVMSDKNPVESFCKPGDSRETENREMWFQKPQQNVTDEKDTNVGKIIKELYTEYFKNTPNHATNIWEEVKQLYEEYLQNAPKCAKKYPNACYYMAEFYLARNNIPKMQEYYRMGQDAEKNRLPFHGPVDIPMKHKLSALNTMIPSARCSNQKCKTLRVDNLQDCPCCKVSYCNWYATKMAV